MTKKILLGIAVYACGYLEAMNYKNPAWFALALLAVVIAVLSTKRGGSSS